MPKRLERFLYSLLKEKDSFQIQSLFRFLLLSLLYFISLFYKLIVFCKFYFHGQVEKQFSVPVISIGNIVAGGTGKTPLTCLLAEQLKERGKVAIVSRGYRSKAEKGRHPVVLSLEARKMAAEECGDEAFLLARRLKDAIVVVGRKRESGIQKAIELGAEVILLDDAMQKRSLYRDCNVAVINSHDPFGGGYFLPRGYLRDIPAALNNADLIVINGKKDESVGLKNSLEDQIRKFSTAPIVWGYVEYGCLQFLNEAFFKKTIMSLETLKNKKVALFCGIGNPERFVEGIKALGAEVVHRLFLADHEAMDDFMMEKFGRTANSSGAEIVLCTEKDAVKISSEAIKKVGLPLAFLPIDFQVQTNSEAWQGIVKNIYKQMNTTKQRIGSRV